MMRYERVSRGCEFLSTLLENSPLFFVLQTEPGQIPEPPRYPPMSSRMMLYGAHRSKPIEKRPQRPKPSSSQPHKPHQKHHQHPSSSHSKPPSKHRHHQNHQPTQVRPIIMVPPGTRTIINIINAADFFGDGVLVPWEAKQSDVSKRKDKVSIERESYPFAGSLHRQGLLLTLLLVFSSI